MFNIMLFEKFSKQNVRIGAAIGVGVAGWAVYRNRLNIANKQISRLKEKIANTTDPKKKKEYSKSLDKWQKRADRFKRQIEFEKEHRKSISAK